MWFLWILVGVLAGAAVHVARAEERSVRRAGEIALVWLLVGYCGVPQLVVAAFILIHPHEVAHWLGFPADNPFQAFLGVAYLGLALIATLAAWYRGAYRIGPALGWAVFWAGATAIHLSDFAGRGALTHGGALHIFATHGLIAVLLVVALVASGLLTRAVRAPRSRSRP